MIIDIHTHVFPEKIRKNKGKFFSEEPGFKLLYSPHNAKMAGIKDTISMMNHHKIDKAVIFGFPWKNIDTCKMNNDYIVECVLQYPDRIIGFVCTDIFNNSFESIIDNYLKAGLLGVGELAFYETGINKEALCRLEPIMNMCRDLPVMIHTNEPIGYIYPGKSPNTLKQIYDLVSSFPENRIILAHWGGGIFFFNLLKKEVKQRLKNVYFDTAASPFLYDPSIYRYAKELAGIEKILFGTDFPLLKPSRYFKEFERSGLIKEDIKFIIGKNAEKILTKKGALV